MTALWLASFLWTAAPGLEVEDTGTCVDGAELGQELRAHVSDVPGALTLRMTPGPEPGSLTVALQPGDGEPLLQRVFPAGALDCPELPRIIAQVVARRLRALAQEAQEAQSTAEVEAAARAGPAPPLEPEPAAVAAEPVVAQPVGVSLRTEAGAALGVLPLGADVRGNVDVVLGRRRGPVAALSATLRLDAPVAVGAGSAVAGTGLLGGSFGYGLDVGPVVVVPTVGVGLGLTVAQGFGFARAETPVLPMAVAMAQVRLETADGYLFGVGAEAPFVQVSLTQSGGGAAADLPQLRFFATVGVRIPVGSL